ncbi:MAG: type II toxin-antitoxin system VapC family toxin [Acidobacteriota bacterium]
MTAVTSPVTLAECLVAPYRSGSAQLQQDFFDLIVHGINTEFLSLDHEHARAAAELRARYNLTLTDTIQIAIGIAGGCQAILSNDGGLKRVTELRVLVVDELTL